MYVDLVVIFSFEYLANHGNVFDEEGLIHNSGYFTNKSPLELDTFVHGSNKGRCNWVDKVTAGNMYGVTLICGS